MTVRWFRVHLAKILLNVEYPKDEHRTSNVQHRTLNDDWTESQPEQLDISSRHSREGECVKILKITEILIVKPDLIRHPGAQGAETAMDSGSSPE